MRADQRRQLRFDGGEISRLDFDQEIAAHDVNHETGDPDLESVPRPGVPLFQRCVKRLFVQQADSGHLNPVSGFA
jgi:hypothetical protein